MSGLRAALGCGSLVVAGILVTNCSSSPSNETAGADGGGTASSGSSSGATTSGVVCSETAGTCGAAGAECACTLPANAPSPDSGLPWKLLPNPSCANFECCVQLSQPDSSCICFNPACGPLDDCPMIASRVGGTVISSCPAPTAGSSSGSSGGSSSGSSSDDGSSEASDAMITGPAIAIAAGNDLTCAILSGGTVVCAGDNVDDELGNSDPSVVLGSSTPVPVMGVTGATAISAGEVFACALVSGGAVECWGANGEGQLGTGSTAPVDFPAAVPGITGATAVAAGSAHACAIVAGGSVKCWGDNTAGELGIGNDTGPDQCGPSMTPCAATPVTVSGLTGATAIAAGQNFTCAIVSGGSVKCWGDNGSGELGNGQATNTAGAGSETTGPEECDNAACSTTPVAVLDVTGATALAAGDGVACALASAGKVYCWGTNGYGELGLMGVTETPVTSQEFSSTPVGFASPSGVTAISAGRGGYTLCLLAQGTAYCWGDNTFGELGTGSMTGPQTCNGTTACSLSPVALSGLSGVTVIAAGDQHACAIVSSGQVACWGNNPYGQFGDGTSNDSLTPETTEW
jgi:alpha-tubulin suppressor-like RCC1 family protein